MTRFLTAVLTREDDAYVALCPELDVASQGAGVDEARANLTEAVELFLECADASEVAGRLHSDVLITHIEVQVA
jgi:predicted RNase H-like HicB family nuclease